MSSCLLDDGTLFKVAFVAVCKALKLNYDIFTKSNDEELSVKHFHRFLNKSTTIVMINRQNNNVFVPARIAEGYTCISAPIDGTDTLRSTIAIGRELRFSIDMNLFALPQLTYNNAQSAVVFLRLTNSNHRFSSSSLEILIEDRCEDHAERVNNNNNIVELVVGNIVLVRTTVQSDASTNKVSKLSYQVRDSFRIVTCTGREGYLVRKLYKPHSPELKFMTVDLCFLPLSLKPCEPVDSSETKYINQPYSPIVNPVCKILNIELYNDT